MKLEQYEYLRDSTRGGPMGKLFKELIPNTHSLLPMIFENLQGRIMEPNAFKAGRAMHELAHQVDFINEGQSRRLRQPSYGFTGGLMTNKALTCELRTCVIQHCLEDFLISKGFIFYFPQSKRVKEEILGIIVDHRCRNSEHPLLAGLVRQEEDTKFNEEVKRITPLLSAMLAKTDEYLFWECRKEIGLTPLTFKEKVSRLFSKTFF